MAEFDSLMPEECAAIFKAARKGEESRLHDEWERTRILATLFVQPYLKKTAKPEEILPFPWDKPKQETGKPAASTRERFEEVKRLLDGQEQKGTDNGEQ